MGSIAVKNEAEWLTLRDSHVGGSEIAALFYEWRLPTGESRIFQMFEHPPEGSVCLGCLNPFKTGYRLWLEKSGRLMPEDLSSNDRVQAGVFLEPAIAEWASTKWEWKLRKVRRYLVHPSVTGWGASCDFESHEEGMPAVEIKNVDGAAFREKWSVEGEHIVMPPLTYALQLQHQIGAKGADHGWIVACVGGNQLFRGRINIHEKTQDRIRSAVTDFWKSIKANVEPTWVADFDSVAKSRLSPIDDALDLTDDAELPDLCQKYLEIKQSADDLDQQLSLVKGQIGAKIGDSTKAKSIGYKLTWPVINRPEKIIPAKVQNALTYRGALTIKEEAK